MSAFGTEPTPTTLEAESTKRIKRVSAVMNFFHFRGNAQIAAYLQVWTKLALFLHCKKFDASSFK